MFNNNFRLIKSMGICSSRSVSTKLKRATYENTPEKTFEHTKAKVIKVYDGDTFWIAIQDKDKEICRYKVRLMGVDTPELRDKDPIAFKAKEYVEEKLLNKIVDIEIYNNKRYQGIMQKEKYGRLLAIVTYKGSSIADELIDLGYGVRLGPNGKKCEDVIV